MIPAADSFRFFLLVFRRFFTVELPEFEICFEKNGLTG